MSSLALLAAAGALALPQLDDRRLVNQLLSALPPMNSGPVLVEVLVSPDKKIEDCRIVYFRGDKRTGDRICRVISGVRAAKAGSNSSGEPVYGAVEFQVGTTTGENAEERIRRMSDDPMQPAADLIVSAASSTNDSVEDGALSVIAFIDTDGTLLDCVAGGDPIDLHAIACEQAGHTSFPVRHNDDDVPVRYVTSLSIQIGESAPNGA